MLNRLRNANRPYEPLFRNLSAQYATKYGAPPIEIPLPDFDSNLYGPSIPPPSTNSINSKMDEEQGQEGTETTDVNDIAAETLVDFAELVSKLGVADLPSSQSVVDASELD